MEKLKQLLQELGSIKDYVETHVGHLGPHFAEYDGQKYEWEDLRYGDPFNGD